MRCKNRYEDRKQPRNTKIQKEEYIRIRNIVERKDKEAKKRKWKIFDGNTNENFKPTTRELLGCNQNKSKEVKETNKTN